MIRLRESSLCLALLALAGCDGTLDPLEAVPVATSPRAIPGVHFVEPFDYHYPDEAFYDSIGSALVLTAALGQTEAGALVYVPPEDGELQLHVGDLLSDSGLVFPASAIELGVVTFADRTRRPTPRDPADRLTMSYVSGARRGGARGDFRGFHQDARAHLPIVPLVIAPDAIELADNQAAATDFVALTQRDFARAWGSAGLGIEFWISASVPSDLGVLAASTHFSGSLTLLTPSSELAIPIELTVLGVELDSLDSQSRYVGVTDTLSYNRPEFREAILRDLRAHGCNALRESLESPAEYQELQERGFSLLINTNDNFPLQEIPAVFDLTGRALFNVPLFEPTAAELESALAWGRSLQAAGAELESEMTLEVARRANAELTFDAWAYAITTHELSDLHAAELDELLTLLGSLRATPTSKEIPLSGHYAEVFNGHVPHQARLLYGLWLAQSGLDFGLAYGYAIVDRQNPFTEPGYNGVAFPAELRGPDGSVERVMLPSLTWEAFRAGIDDWRYVLTARRLTEGNPTLQARLDELLQPYAALYSSGDRVDYRNREADVRLTRAKLAALIVDAL